MSVTWDPEKALARIRQGALQGVLIGAQAVHARGSALIANPPKSGRVYRKRGRVHQASAPGEPPAADMGRLGASGDVYLDPAEIAARINWSAAHARPLELGTEKMEPRPFARRALAEETATIREAVATQVGKALA